MPYKDYRFTKDHEWVQITDGIATIGITKHATNELGEVVFIEVLDSETLKQKDEVGTVESVKTVSSVYTPISGAYIESNEQVIKDPNLINEDPMKDGWLVKIKPDNLKELDTLLDYEAYKEFVDSL
ncbi:MAG: glycine cleavage system protein GcvH [bacterium]